MNKNTGANASISIGRSHVQAKNRSSQRNSNCASYISVKAMQLKIIRRTAKRLYYSKHRYFTAICAFSVFTSLSIAVGVLVVCHTSSNGTDKTCRLTFERTIETINRYDSHPRHVAVGDFNKDNHLDLVVANSGTDSIGVLLGYGNGTFASQITYPTGLQSSPYSVAVGDFNNDTLLDIAVAKYGINSIGILLGRGDGTFRNQITLSLGSSRPLSLAVGDFNNDKQLDIVVANYGTSNVIVLLGFGNGYFRIQTIYNMGYDSTPYSIALADFNNDTLLDIAIVNYGTSELVILLSNRNGTFVSQKYSTGSGSHPCSLAIGDFNNDTQVDIAVANSGTNNVYVFQGYMNGIFTNITTYDTGLNSRPRSIAVGHFDNDIELDLVVANSGIGNILMLKGDGNGAFATLITHSTGYNSNPIAIAIGDFDNDSRPDIVIANNGTNNILILSAYTVYPNTSQTTYYIDIAGYPNSVAVGDFNHDNNLDIVVANRYNSRLNIFFGVGDGTFLDPTIYFINSNNAEPYFVAVGDFNNDNNIDIVVVISGIDIIGILVGYANGVFGFRYGYLTGNNSSPRCAAVGDFNNDTNLDIITANYNTGDVCVFLGSGDARFLKVTKHSTGTDVFSNFVVVGDFNGDYFLDFVVANSFQNNLGGTLTVHLGNGNGTYFQISMIISTGAYRPTCVAVGNLNNDSLLDIVFVTPYYDRVGVILGYGNGTFGDITTYSTGPGSYPCSVALGYFNKDTFLDIAVTNQWYFSLGVFIGYGNGTFAPQKTFSTKSESLPLALAFGDFNNDHQSDLVVTNSITGNMGVFLVHYDTDFISETSYSTGSSPHPYSLAIADINNDSRLDIITANSGNDNIQILLGNGMGTFTNRITYSTGLDSHPQYVMVADFDKDNRLDIAVANSWNDSINVFLGFGNGTFDAASSYSTNSSSFPNSIAMGDFNKDSWTDIVVANQGADNVGVFLGFNYALFTTNNIPLTTRNSIPYYIVAADFNDDSQLDIAIAYRDSGMVNIYLGHGNGSFAESMVNSVGSLSEPISIAVGDFNNDSRLDIAVANSANFSISILLGYSNGTFAENVLYSTGSASPVFIATGDFNNDASLDIVVANRMGDNIGIFLGYGNGIFAIQVPYSMPNGSSPAWIAIDDFNNDSIPDIAVANPQSNNIEILLGIGDGTFTSNLTYSTGDHSGPCSIAIGDLNKDNRRDIAVANANAKNIGVFFGYGNGTFSSQKTFSTGSTSVLNSIIIGDLNKDMIPDILVSDYEKGNGYIGVFYGFGNGNFTLLQIYSTGFNSNPMSFAMGDFNNDNRVDLVVTDTNKVTLSIMLQYKTQPFGTQTTFSTGNTSRPASVGVSDFNNDTHLDIAVANYGTNNIGILFGFGDGTFADQQMYSTGDRSGPFSIVIADFNNDHRPDIVVTNSGTNNIGIFLGDDNGTFAAIRTYSTGESSVPSSVAVNDLNRDNYLDLVVANWGINNILVFFGLDKGTFSNPKSYSVGYGSRPQSVAIGDFTNDHWLDIAVVNDGTGDVEIFIQRC